MWSLKLLETTSSTLWESSAWVGENRVHTSREAEVAKVWRAVTVLALVISAIQVHLSASHGLVMWTHKFFFSSSYFNLQVPSRFWYRWLQCIDSGSGWRCWKPMGGKGTCWEGPCPSKVRVSLGSGRDTRREDGARETSHNWQKQQKVGGGWK